MDTLAILAKEYRPSMDEDVLRSWAKDVIDAINEPTRADPVAFKVNAPAMSPTHPISSNAAALFDGILEGAGFAQFNRCDTLCVDVPNGGFTISAKTSQGKRVTFYFGPYKTSGPPQCVDIAYHDSGLFQMNGGSKVPLFDTICMNVGGTPFDSRASEQRGRAANPVSVACILIEDPKAPA